jgi:hypothetical protein
MFLICKRIILNISSVKHSGGRDGFKVLLLVFEEAAASGSIVENSVVLLT